MIEKILYYIFLTDSAGIPVAVIVASFKKFFDRALWRILDVASGEMRARYGKECR